MKSRQFNSKFFNDTYIQTLSLTEKFIFIYYLFNEHVNWLGCYEVSDRTALFELGDDITQNKLTSAKNRFVKDEKIYFVNNYVIIKNSEKYDSILANKQLMNSALKQFECLPADVKSAFLELKPEQVILVYKSMFSSFGYDLDCSLRVAYTVGYIEERSRIKKKEIEERREKKEVETQDFRLIEILDYFNSKHGKKFKVTDAWSANALKWLEVYTIVDIKKAIDNMDSWWGNADIVLLFRTKNSQGPCDYIGELINLEKKEVFILK